MRIRREPVMTKVEWAFPAPPVQREVIERHPDLPTDRPPLLFVHGAAHGAWCWDEHWMPEAAARGWSSYAVSLRGHGGSGGAEALPTTPLRHYVHDVLQTIADLPRPPILIGHSMGGLVVQHVLERYPAVAGVLVASVPPDHGVDVFGSLLRHRPSTALKALAGGSLELDRGLLFSDDLDRSTADRHVARLGEESRIAQYQMVLPRRPRPSRAPVLVLGAGDDHVVPPAAQPRLARHYGTRARMFRGMGHDLMLDAAWEAPLDVMLSWFTDELAAG